MNKEDIALRVHDRGVCVCVCVCVCVREREREKEKKGRVGAESNLSDGLLR